MHMLDFRTDGVARMMYLNADGPPWHGLGVGLDQVPNKEEAIIASGMDWLAEKSQLYVVGKSGQAMFKVPGRYAVVRSDKNPGEEDYVLGDVSDRYIPIQNRELFEVGEMLTQEGAAIYHTAGVINGGRRVWVLVKLPNSIEVVGGDITDKYLLVTSTHAGSEAARMMFTPIRVVCNNTLTAAISREGIQARVWHAGSLKWQFSNALELLGIANKVFDETGEKYRAMAAKDITLTGTKEYFCAIFPDNPEAKHNTLRARQRGVLLHNFEGGGKGSQLNGVRGTVWGAYNSVTEFLTHRHLNSSKPERRLDSEWFGTAAKIRQDAFDKAMALVG